MIERKVSEEIKNKWKHKLSVIKKCYDKGSLLLNDWELSFIDSIDIKLSKDEDISFKQSSILTRIYERIN